MGQRVLQTTQVTVPCMPEQQQLQLVQQVRDRLAQFGTGRDREQPGVTVEQWQAQLVARVLQADDFSAAIPASHQAAWQAFLQDDPGLNEQLAVDVVTHGVKPDLVNPHSESQRAHPRHQRLIKDMLRQLTRHHGAQRAREMLEQDRPPPMEFQNSPSCDDHLGFVIEAAQQLRAWGVMKTPQEVGLQDWEVIIVAGISVDVDRKQKKRMCYDGRWDNRSGMRVDGGVSSQQEWY